MDRPSVLLTGFSDEASASKSIVEQCCVCAALGLRYLSLRFVDAGNGAKNLMNLDEAELQFVRRCLDDFGLSVSSIGSPIGKVKLKNVEDGTHNVFRPFDEYLNDEFERACDLAERFDSRLIRGFSFYHPRGERPEDHLEEVSERMLAFAHRADARGLTFGLEVEANLVGQTGELLAEIHRRVNHPALVLIFDGANLVTQGFTTQQVFQQYQAMKSGLGWIHIKDYQHPNPGHRVEHVDEEALSHFVPCDRGDSGHRAILADVRETLPELESRLAPRGIPGLFLDLEPHVRGGGQFGGFSGPDGYGVALRALLHVLDEVAIGYDLRQYEDL